jgi:hypothetical protein
MAGLPEPLCAPGQPFEFSGEQKDSLGHGVYLGYSACNMKRIVLILTLLSLCGCTGTGHIYNLQTGEVGTLTYSYNGSGRGKISSVLKGVALNGEYSVVSNADVTWGNIYASVYSPSGFASGTATRTSIRTHGERRGSAVLTGADGMILDCELLVGTNGHGTGGCKDNHEAKYKLMY